MSWKSWNERFDISCNLWYYMRAGFRGILAYPLGHQANNLG